MNFNEAQVLGLRDDAKAKMGEAFPIYGANVESASEDYANVLNRGSNRLMDLSEYNAMLSIDSEKYRRKQLGDPYAWYREQRDYNANQTAEVKKLLLRTLEEQARRGRGGMGGGSGYNLNNGLPTGNNNEGTYTGGGSMTWNRPGADGDYSKTAAFTDAEGLMAKQRRESYDKAMPGITAAMEGAGTQSSSMSALLQQKAAEIAAENSAALGVRTAVDYGDISSRKGQLALEHEKFAAAERAKVLELLLGGLNGGGILSSGGMTSGGKFYDPGLEYEMLRAQKDISGGENATRAGIAANQEMTRRIADMKQQSIQEQQLGLQQQQINNTSDQNRIAQNAASAAAEAAIEQANLNRQFERDKYFSGTASYSNEYNKSNSFSRRT